MKVANIYAKNLELLSRDNPLQAYKLERAQSTSWEFCYTHEKELNLIDKSSAKDVYWHSQQGALWEAQCWAAKLPLSECDVFFIYGLGLGYAYLPLKQWLKENPERYLVFLEDDFCVMNFFLKTELATELLENSQIIIKIFPKIEPNEDGWAKMRLSETFELWAFAFHKPHVSALPLHFLRNLNFFTAFSIQWLSAIAKAEQILNEYYPLKSLVFRNFYANILYVGHSISGQSLANSFKNIPAILSGAGPSLTKQLPILKTLMNHALIMASGSAMNALTQHSIMPHVAGAIDPTSTQRSRQLTSFGYNLPVFYQNRFFEKAFIEWHGPMIYAGENDGYGVFEWFEKELEIKITKKMIRGVSTTNFLLEEAIFLGCNPIILLGTDLAYINDKRYAKEVFAHPSDDEKYHEEIEKKQKKLIEVRSTDGKSVLTNKKWLCEAIYLAGSQQRNPEIAILNATEGGMEIPLISYHDFSFLINHYLYDSWDIQGWLHGNIQNAAHETIATNRVFEAIEKWKKSLERCEECLKHLINHFQQFKINSSKIKAFFLNIYREKAILWEQELIEEPAYQFLLKALNTVFETINRLVIRKLLRIKNKRCKIREKIVLEIDRLKFLEAYVQDHLESIQMGLKNYKEREAILLNDHHLPKTKQIQELPPEYRLSNDEIVINEPTLRVKLKIPFKPFLIPKTLWPIDGQEPNVEALIGQMNNQKEGQTLFFYSNGSIKAEAFYQAGKLHGPWTFYSTQGIILFRSWFIEGKREGKTCSYYRDGTLYQSLGYREGEAQGKHLCYYPNGMLKTLENYDRGILHGEIYLYYPNGMIKKEQHFVKGQLHGIERIWNILGILISEISYMEGKAIIFQKEEK